LEAIFLVGFGWFFFGISGGHFDFFGWFWGVGEMVFFFEIHFFWGGF